MRHALVLAAVPPGPRVSSALTELATSRLQTISFCIVVLIGCALLVQALWNLLRRDAPSLPRASFGRALGAVVLWALLFIAFVPLVPGARAFIAGGAWETQQSAHASDPADSLAVRRGHMEVLRDALWAYARDVGDGRLPAHEFVAEVPEASWLTPDASGERYIYVAGRRAGNDDGAVLYEPPAFGDERFVLLNDGRIERRAVGEIEAALHDEALSAQQRQRQRERETPKP